MSAFGSRGMLNVLLQASYASKVNGAFENFLETHINISPVSRSAASTSQTNLREFLKDESSRDLTGTFPKILQENDRDFIAGSFARHTKIWPLDDIDILFPLDGVGLVYFRGGMATPNNVVSDGGFGPNPLLTPRWMNGDYISSDRLVAEFAKVLRRRYSQSDVSKEGEAISVQLTIGSSAESNGLKFDVVPCFRLEPRDGSPAFYLIPDGHNGWKHTNPRHDEEMCEYLQKFHGGYYRKVVKLMKYWNANQINSALGSYYIELALANSFSSMQQGIASIDEGVKLGFQALWNTIQQGNIPSPVKDAPAVALKPMSISSSQKLYEAVTLSSSAVAYKHAGQVDKAIGPWKVIFGSEFE